MTGAQTDALSCLAGSIIRTLNGSSELQKEFIENYLICLNQSVVCPLDEVEAHQWKTTPLIENIVHKAIHKPLSKADLQLMLDPEPIKTMFKNGDIVLSNPKKLKAALVNKDDYQKVLDLFDLEVRQEFNPRALSRDDYTVLVLDNKYQPVKPQSHMYFTYVLKYTDSNGKDFLKIGHSEFPKERLSAINNKTGLKGELVAVKGFCDKKEAAKFEKGLIRYFSSIAPYKPCVYFQGCGEVVGGKVLPDLLSKLG